MMNCPRVITLFIFPDMACLLGCAANIAIPSRSGNAPRGRPICVRTHTFAFQGAKIPSQ
jgi:hypothetical protein